MEILIEKYTLFLGRHDAVGDLMPEKRGKVDAALQAECLAIYENGTRYAPSEAIRKRIVSPLLKFRAKTDNIAGLELCDLIAHPSYMYVRQCHGHAVMPGPFAAQVIQTLCNLRYDRSQTGIIKGYGWKYFS